ncbi:MAG: hypothetical protein ACTSUE_07190 [Promethearchaeota archaeon]
MQGRNDKTQMAVAGKQNALETSNGTFMVTPDIIFPISSNLSIWLIDDETHVVVGRKLVQVCKKLVLQLDDADIKATRDAKDMDEITDILRKRKAETTKYPGHKSEYNKGIITSKEEFHAHCSNFQAWHEHDYDPRIMPSSISYPVLGALFEAGDATATKALQQVVKNRLYSGSAKVLNLLPKNYTSTITKTDWNEIFNNLPSDVEIMALGRTMLGSHTPAYHEKIPDWVVQMVNSVPDHYIYHPGMKDEVYIFTSFSQASTTNKSTSGLLNNISFSHTFSSLDELSFPAGKLEGVESVHVEGPSHLHKPTILHIADLVNVIQDPSLVKSLLLNNCELESLQGIDAFSGLRELEIGGNKNITEIPRLNGFNYLKKIIIVNVSVESLDFLGDLPALEYFHFQNECPFKLIDISHLHSLKEVRISNFIKQDSVQRMLPRGIERIYLNPIPYFSVNECLEFASLQHLRKISLRWYEIDFEKVKTVYLTKGFRLTRNGTFEK